MMEFMNELNIKDGEWTLRVYAGGHAYLTKGNTSIQVSGGGALACALSNEKTPVLTEKQKMFWNKCRAFLQDFDVKWKSLLLVENISEEKPTQDKGDE